MDNWGEFEAKAKFLWDKAPMTTNFSFKCNSKKKKVQIRMVNRDDKKPLILSFAAKDQEDIGRLIRLNRFILMEALGPMVKTVASDTVTSSRKKKKKKSKKK